MITKIKIDNLQGILKKIEVSTIANNKIKREKCYVSSISKDTNLLKTICIIGSNGSGKTSFLNAIVAIQTFITFPFRKSAKERQNFIEQIKRLPDDFLNQLLDDFNTLRLPEKNIDRSKDRTTISLEVYVPSREKNISGIYNYFLEYDDDYQKKGVATERLTYKKDFNVKNETVIFDVHNVIESELGTTMLYENNTIGKEGIQHRINNSQNIDYYKSFGNEVMDCFSFSFGDMESDLNEIFKFDQKRFIELCNLADEKIVNVEIEKQENNDVLIYLNENGNKLYFSQLSNGTQKTIVLGNEILTAIKNNKVLFIDEIETALHPSLANFLISIINKNDCKSFAQLIFTTHSPLIAFSMHNDQLIFIDNHDKNYTFSNITNAIKNGLSKDKSSYNAWMENLLIKNPDISKISDFIENYVKDDKL